MSRIYDRMSIDEYFRLGYTYQMEGDLRSAAECYLRSIEMQPSPEAHTFLGWVLCLMGELDGAIEECKKAIKLNPKFGHALNDMGVYFTKKRDYEKAISFLKKACGSKDFDNPAFPHFNLALVYSKKGMLRLATQELNRALELNPGFSSAKELLNRIEAVIH